MIVTDPPLPADAYLPLMKTVRFQNYGGRPGPFPGLRRNIMPRYSKSCSSTPTPMTWRLSRTGGTACAGPGEPGRP